MIPGPIWQTEVSCCGVELLSTTTDTTTTNFSLPYDTYTSNNCVASLGACRDRVEILRALTKDGTRPRLGPGVDLAQLGADTRCEGFSGADVGNLVRQVRGPTEIVY